jgi:rhodanese-related sulfurtransferase
VSSFVPARPRQGALDLPPNPEDTVTETQLDISPDMTMEAIMEVAPSAQRALFQRYHVGGCSSCGFQPSDTLAQVCKDHNLLDVKGVLETILLSDRVDKTTQMDPDAVRAWLAAGEDFTFIDVQPQGEDMIARVDGSESLDYNDSAKYMQREKDHRFVFICADGDRSLDVASYFIGHGFTDVHAVRGGVLAWTASAEA